MNSTSFVGRMDGVVVAYSANHAKKELTKTWFFIHKERIAALSRLCGRLPFQKEPSFSGRMLAGDTLAGVNSVVLVWALYQ